MSAVLDYKTENTTDATRGQPLIARVFARKVELEDARVFGGKEVVNILPKGAPDKGIALDRERVRLHCGAAVYVGDDETDEDVFKMDVPDQILGIRVGFKGDSAARFYVPDQEAVVDLYGNLLIHLLRS